MRFQKQIFVQWIDEMYFEINVVKQRLFKNNYRLLFLFNDDYNNFFSFL